MIESQLRSQAVEIASAGHAGLGNTMMDAADEIERLRCALSELAALVRGECPRLLDGDSGGCGRLDIDIDELLTPNDEAKPRAEGASA